MLTAAVTCPSFRKTFTHLLYLIGRDEISSLPMYPKMVLAWLMDYQFSSFPFCYNGKMPTMEHPKMNQSDTTKQLFFLILSNRKGSL
jgi:hypothetical protein